MVAFEYSGYNFDPLFNVLELVNKYEAYAVIGFNSYYFFYEGNWKYWCSNQMDFENLSILEYDKDKIIDFLGLNYQQIPLFIYLCNLKDMNKLVSDVSQFH